MSKSFILWKGCWIYMRETERKNMTQIIKILERVESASISYFRKKIKASGGGVTHALWLLVGAKILKVQQRKEARIFSFYNENKWRDTLRKALKNIK